MSPPSTSSSTAFNYENANHSNRNFPLTIDVENPARSSWPEVDVHDQPTQAVRRAQQIALDMIRQRIKSESEELHRIRDDQKVLADVIAENYSAQLSTDVEQTQKKIKELDRALQELRLKYPTLVPPPRPPRRPSYMEGNETWQCVRCAAETAGHSYRCVRCQLPRSNIDPREAQRCGCVTCSSSLGEKLFVSMSPGDDGWTLIDKLGWPINSTSS
ncbi:unnamed protein product [Caenorhabditis auriculariae]|uniref:RanBP2-type domain-containing protein n=1 Tax=Caenorhabditis auriculariae TaxID=2777116 RepID=A0A8S1HX15_9PELO|nr:unnamed protein product [Caenorhabditis auriculariae]